jgi:hypothetical protein
MKVTSLSKSLATYPVQNAVEDVNKECKQKPMSRFFSLFLSSEKFQARFADIEKEGIFL